MSFSWADPHFVALFAAREEERMTDRLAEFLRAEAERLGEADWGSPFKRLEELDGFYNAARQL